MSIERIILGGKEVESFCPGSKKRWREWLQKNHQSAQSIWLVFYKVSSGKATLSWSEAVDEALCFGWIDSLKKTLDEERYVQFFSKRNPKSTWSKINKGKVQQLISEGLMTSAGQRCIDIAKQNGSWVFLDQVEALIMPADLEEAFATKPGSKAYYLTLSKSSKKIILYWIVSAKRSETRQKRVAETVEAASQRMKPKQFR
jgi:uncharacterized protein YdeI (YjbR/CyaY-like superfamily)